ncbi:unnamed protein product [Nezara viridula]|uniref:SH3 domain-binding protein 5-like n=1 Tax=Nezara viridula TaxID=85310 RepID=A0A9P0MUT3_NEZVI|nr:unnamed protein product [Nezara viridula]
MDNVSSETDHAEESAELDPRIQVELEKLNTSTDLINKLEIELDEANTTFRILMNDSTRRLKVMGCKLGSCIERARPYYTAVDIARKAQLECQSAAVKFQRANEIHQAAKETVALAEARFMSKQHEWKFDNAWQEMLNHATIKVTEAEYQKAQSGQEHQKRAALFHVAEQRVSLLEQKLKRSILKARPYFDEKAVCQSQLDAQKRRIEQLQSEISKAKFEYSQSLRRLELISEEIHHKRKDKSRSVSPEGPREPGVGSEQAPSWSEKEVWDLEKEMEKCELHSIGSLSIATSSAVSEDELDVEPIQEDLEELRQKVRELSEGKQEDWAQELDEAITRLDNAMFQQECHQQLQELANSSK